MKKIKYFLLALLMIPCLSLFTACVDSSEEKETEQFTEQEQTIKQATARNEALTTFLETQTATDTDNADTYDAATSLVTIAGTGTSLYYLYDEMLKGFELVDSVVPGVLVKEGTKYIITDPESGSKITIDKTSNKFEIIVESSSLNENISLTIEFAEDKESFKMTLVQGTKTTAVIECVKIDDGYAYQIVGAADDGQSTFNVAQMKFSLGGTETAPTITSFSCVVGESVADQPASIFGTTVPADFATGEGAIVYTSAA